LLSFHQIKQHENSLWCLWLPGTDEVKLVCLTCKVTSDSRNTNTFFFLSLLRLLQSGLLYKIASQLDMIATVTMYNTFIDWGKCRHYLRGCYNTYNCRSYLNHAISKQISVLTVISDHLLPTCLWPSWLLVNDVLLFRCFLIKSIAEFLLYKPHNYLEALGFCTIDTLPSFLAHTHSHKNIHTYVCVWVVKHFCLQIIVDK